MTRDPEAPVRRQDQLGVAAVLAAATRFLELATIGRISVGGLNG